MLPDGVTGFGSIFDTSFIGSMALVTGALPAEFGLRTVGLVDITTRKDVFNNSGSVGMYGGSHGTITPSIEYGGTFGGNCPATTPPRRPMSRRRRPMPDCFPGVQYYFTGRYLQTTVGLESATPAYNAIHDFSQQEQGFAYMSAFVDPTTRVSLIAGTSINNFQIPERSRTTDRNDGKSAGHQRIRHHQFRFSAAQRKPVARSLTLACCRCRHPPTASTDNCPISPATTICNSYPDPVGDLLLNGIASTITRTSYTNGIQGDGSYQLNSAHTLRAGFTRQRRAGLRRQYVAGRALHDLRRHRQWCAGVDHRQRLEARRADGGLCPGRVEADQPVDDQRRPALRPDV